MAKQNEGDSQVQLLIAAAIIGIMVSIILSFIFNFISRDWGSVIALVIGGIAAARFLPTRKRSVIVGLAIGLVFGLITAYGIYSLLSVPFYSQANTTISVGNSTISIPSTAKNDSIRFAYGSVYSLFGTATAALILWTIILSMLSGAVGGLIGSYVPKNNAANAPKQQSK
jgi:hypothetical protein